MGYFKSIRVYFLYVIWRGIHKNPSAIRRWLRKLWFLCYDKLSRESLTVNSANNIKISPHKRVTSSSSRLLRPSKLWCNLILKDLTQHFQCIWRYWNPNSSYRRRRRPAAWEGAINLGLNWGLDTLVVILCTMVWYESAYDTNHFLIWPLQQTPLTFPWSPAW